MKKDFVILFKELDTENEKATIVVQDSNLNKHTVYIVPCYDAFEQYGAGTDVMWFTLPIARKLVRNKFKKF
jgi:hypothetical protein